MTIPILVVDANLEFAILIRQALEEGDRFEVSLASSPEEALALARDQDFDLAIIDFALPGVAALSLVEALRALQPGLAIIAIPPGDSPDPVAFRRAGVDGILTKPFYLPNLPDIVGTALSGRLDTGRLRPPPPRLEMPLSEPEPQDEPTAAEPSPPEPVALAPGAEPPWLSDVGRAARYLTRLTLESSAEAAMLIRGQTLIASAGQLPRAQLLELTSEVAESWAKEGRRGAFARFVRLPGTAQDFMLYATGFAGDLVLSLVFSAETPFGMIRRQAEDLAHALWQVDPLNPVRAPQAMPPKAGKRAESPPVAGKRAEPPPVPHRASGEAASPPRPSTVEASVRVVTDLPGDWIPEPGQAGAGERLLAEFTDDQAPPERPPMSRPTEAVAMAPAIAQPADLPLDWLPVITHSARHVPYLEDPAPPVSSPPAQAPKPPAAPQAEPAPQPSQTLPEPPEPDPRLAYSIVMAPRFPEHRLAGSLVESLTEWTRRLCVGWDWKAERLAVTEDTLLLEVRLPPDEAPAAAADRLANQLSDRILETYPHLNPGFPSGRFWATARLLKSGAPPSATEIRAFVTQLRRTQGFQT